MNLTVLLSKNSKDHRKGAWGHAKWLVFLLLLMLSLTGLQAQVYEPGDEDDFQEDYLIRGERKSAARAIIMSAIFPGSGHFYVNRRAIGTYLFPIVEIALWVGYFHFDSQGRDIESDYMAYADEHYKRWRQDEVEVQLINHPQSSSIYNDLHFRLDDRNTQHFYEDIGKYRKYIFGWADWYEIYAEHGVEWEFTEDGIWVGNYPTHPDHAGAGVYDEPYSELRQHYIDMRRDAQQNFDRRVLTTFGLAFNRIASSLDAVRLTTAYNRELRYAYNPSPDLKTAFDFRVQPQWVNNQITPTISLIANFR